MAAVQGKAVSRYDRQWPIRRHTLHSFARRGTAGGMLHTLFELTATLFFSVNVLHFIWSAYFGWLDHKDGLKAGAPMMVYRGGRHES